MKLKFLPVNLYTTDDLPTHLQLGILTRELVWEYKTKLYWDIWEKYRGKNRRQIRCIVTYQDLKETENW